MTTYTLHLPPDARPGDPSGLEDAKLVKDGFAWGAFFFNFLWFFAHRLWLAGFGVLIAFGLLQVLLNLFDVHRGFFTLAHLLASILLGLEANTLRRWTYARHGSPVVDVVSADNQDEAEAKALARWLERPEPAPARAVAQGAPRPGPAFARPAPVLGLFPDAERPR
ncbi:DUF2628 domain-containing protein [Microvirga pudoricolor]|uniref:DUF2628 domain-containing protein n=1 Tax=Microvirga pudoricolor TaxID=2778729 RepID=UPI00194F588E|nr:DUF2628 domain-containing protein [Microvirga pudoricolor]MBM6593993.1 DUF2628 domain-containing protein [Microvirga pudoricolor]